jgi:hypothetical protein
MSKSTELLVFIWSKNSYDKKLIIVESKTCLAPRDGKCPDDF